MMDEIFDRQYQTARADLNAAIASIGRELGKSLKVLHSIEWSAPWVRPASKNDRAGLA